MLAKQGEVKQAMAFRAVVRHIAHGVAEIKQGIQIGDRASDAAPKGRFPHGGAPAHDGNTAGSTQYKLRQRVHKVNAVVRNADESCRC
jgi:hypothetical protein